MRERLTITPRQFELAALAGVIALSAIVVSGAAVRLTGSGLGCPDWPRCYGHDLPPLTTHAVIEYSNRIFSGLVGVVCVIVAALAWRRRPLRRDLAWLALVLPLGIVAQAVLGGLTVRGRLDYGYVMAHFLLSFVILAGAFALYWRAREERQAVTHDRRVVLAVRAMLLLAAVTVLAGTAATAAGPHAGGSPGQHINRLSFDGTGTMDFVIHRHGEIGLLLLLAACGLWQVVAARDGDPGLRRSLAWLAGLLVMQGIVGIVQYELKLPVELVIVHVALATGIWVTALWATCAAGPLVAARERPPARAQPVA
jgi:cytochrome c oxidase assembly protein subunit 15